MKITKEILENSIRENESFMEMVCEKKYGHEDLESVIWNVIEKCDIKDVEQQQLMLDNYFIPAGSILAACGTDQKMSMSNCYLCKIEEDTIEGIYEAHKKIAKTYSYRGGSGVDITILRPADTPVSGAANTSSGAVSFMPSFSVLTKTVCQNGRRGALIITIDIRHPDTLKFIWSKAKPEDVFEVDIFNGETPNISGANISLKVTNAFMEAVKHNLDWEFYFPDYENQRELYKKVWDGDYDKWSSHGGKFKSYGKIKAREVMRQLVEAAHMCGDPGIFLIDNVQNNTFGTYIHDSLKPMSCNPCLSGDTIVAVADGRNGVTIKELSEKNELFPVYSARKAGGPYKHWKVEIKQATAFKSGTKETIKVNLSDGSSFICTPDHKIALVDRTYKEAQYCDGLELGKFFTFSNKNNMKNYRHINSKTNGHSKQYNMIFNYIHGGYDTQKGEIHHLDSVMTNDLIENLSLIPKNQHVDEHNAKRINENANSKFKIKNKEAFNWEQRRKNILGNASRYNWSNEKIENELNKLGKRPEKIEIDNNVDLSNPIFVKSIEKHEKIDVYDLSVQDNHNFYIITKTDDEKFLNSSGVLVHNCGEQPLSYWNNCMLGAFVLHRYIKNQFTERAYFDYDKFKRDVGKATRIMNIFSDYNEDKHPLPEQIEADKFGKRIGIEVTGVGDALAMLGIIYDSEEARHFLGELSELITNYSVNESIQLAKENGCCPALKNIEARKNLLENSFFDFSDAQKDGIWNYGLANTAFLNIGPCGTISIVSLNCTGGIEPLYMFSYKRLNRVDNKQYTFIHYLACKFMLEHFDEFEGVTLEEAKKKLNYVEANEVCYEKRIKNQAAFQRYADASISSTLNLPNDTPYSVIEDVFMKGYEYNLKGITVFRDGCKAGVLSSSEEKEEEAPTNQIELYEKELLDIESSERHRVIWKKNKLYMNVSVDENDQPIEIFAKLPKEAGINGDGQFNPGVWQERTSNWDLICRLISMCLRYGINLKELLVQLEKSTYSMVDAAGILKRILSRYSLSEFDEDGEIVGENCPSCGNLSYIKQGGCGTCVDCGFSECG